MASSSQMKTFLLLFLLPLLSACTDTAQKKTTQQTAVATTDSLKSTAANEKYTAVATWIDDFKNFRNAVYNKDPEQLKSYFEFPLNADSSQIWSAIDTEGKRQGADSNHFNEEDFNKHYHELFPAEFLKCLLKIKSAKLYSTGENASPEFNENDQLFTLYTNFYKDTQELHLNMAYGGGLDENGERVSEGEHNIIYVFTVTDHKHLKFKKIVFAG